jgi:hypothetical protein
VRADWEGIGAAVLVALIALLFIGGLIRTIRKRRTDPGDVAETNTRIETDATPTARADAGER